MENSITASIVLYKTKIIDLEKVIESVFNTKQNIKLYLIDNSPTNDLMVFQQYNSKIEYIHQPKNPGFSASHNFALQKAIESGSSYHFVINPDIYYDDDVISAMLAYMEKDKTIGMMMPKVLNVDGSVQHLPKLLPSPLSILWRKVKRPAKAFQKFINQYELRQVSPSMIYTAPILSGCFTMLNMEAIQKVGTYNDAYFMYFEDWDLSRRMQGHYKTIYYPLVSVYHGYDSGANKNSRLFKIFIQSAITYFNEWGWFFDSERKKINKDALSQFK